MKGNIACHLNDCNTRIIGGGMCNRLLVRPTPPPPQAGPRGGGDLCREGDSWLCLGCKSDVIPHHILKRGMRGTCATRLLHSSACKQASFCNPLFAATLVGKTVSWMANIPESLCDSAAAQKIACSTIHTCIVISVGSIMAMTNSDSLQALAVSPHPGKMCTDL